MTLRESILKNSGILNEVSYTKAQAADQKDEIKKKFGDESERIPYTEFKQELKDTPNKKLEVRNKKEDLVRIGNGKNQIPMTKKIDFKCTRHPFDNLPNTEPKDLINGRNKLCPRNDNDMSTSVVEEYVNTRLKELVASHNAKPLYKNLQWSVSYIPKTKLGIKSRESNHQQELDVDLVLKFNKPIMVNGNEIDGYAFNINGPTHWADNKEGNPRATSTTGKFENDVIRIVTPSPNMKLIMWNINIEGLPIDKVNDEEEDKKEVKSREKQEKDKVNNWITKKFLRAERMALANSGKVSSDKNDEKESTAGNYQRYMLLNNLSKNDDDWDRNSYIKKNGENGKLIAYLNSKEGKEKYKGHEKEWSTLYQERNKENFEKKIKVLQDKGLLDNINMLNFIKALRG